MAYNGMELYKNCLIRPDLYISLVVEYMFSPSMSPLRKGIKVVLSRLNGRSRKIEITSKNSIKFEIFKMISFKKKIEFKSISNRYHFKN